MSYLCLCFDSPVAAWLCLATAPQPPHPLVSQWLGFAVPPQCPPSAPPIQSTCVELAWALLRIGATWERIPLDCPCHRTHPLPHINLLLHGDTSSCYDRKTESKYTSHRRRRQASCVCTRDNILYFGCHLDLVRLTEHLRGTRKSEHEKNIGSCYLHTHKHNAHIRAHYTHTHTHTHTCVRAHTRTHTFFKLAPQETAGGHGPMRASLFNIALPHTRTHTYTPAHAHTLLLGALFSIQELQALGNWVCRPCAPPVPGSRG